ncbi:hypothetical protein PAPHI01_1957 [Pancytospora philotis]|nr:hypothetical protein PAPHI01_1957 [Pancytospora philotis]
MAEARRRLTNLLKGSFGSHKLRMGKAGQAFASFKCPQKAEEALALLDGLSITGTVLHASMAHAEMRWAKWNPQGTDEQVKSEADSPIEGNSASVQIASADINSCLLIVKGIDEKQPLLGADAFELVRGIRTVPCKSVVFLDFATVDDCRAFYNRNSGRLVIDGCEYALTVAKSA